MKDTVFIFGAGASHDCIDLEMVDPLSKDWQPPLANKIMGELGQNRYDDMLRDFPILSSLVPKIRRKMREPDFDFENYMLLIKKNAENNIEALAELICMRFYLRKLFSNCSDSYVNTGDNYTALIGTLLNLSSTKPKITFATFNYDTILDQALVGKGVIKQLEDMKDYIYYHFKYIKLHGSIDWAYTFDIDGMHGNNPSECSRYMAINYPLLGTAIQEKNMMNISSAVADVLPYSTVPAIAIPITDKADFECPDKHMSQLVSSLKDAENIVCIGWKAGDKHFRNLLKQYCSVRHPKLIVVSRDEIGASTIVEILSEDFAPRSTMAIGGGFSSFIHIEQEELDRILSSD